jgi:hypothetical protein
MITRQEKIKALKQLQTGEITIAKFNIEVGSTGRISNYSNHPESLLLAKEMGWQINKNKQEILLPAKLTEEEVDKAVNFINNLT